MPEPRFLSVAEVARLFGLSDMTLYRAIKENQFPAIRIRRRLFVSADVIDEMAAAAEAKRGVVDTADWTAA